MSKTAIVVYEDRPEYETGIKLLIESLSKHFSEGDIHLFAPNATPDLQDWLAQKSAQLHQENFTELSGWNVKPSLLLWALDQGYQRAIWFDSDMIITQPLPKPLLTSADDVLVVSQLPRTSQFRAHEHAAGWNLEPGRRFRRVPSGCCMAATDKHREFLEQWKTMLGSAEYQHWQRQSRDIRPLCFRGSDAVLLSLLGSKNFEELPLYLLKSGRDIAQCLNPRSYTPDERMLSLLHGLPPIIHAMGIKPWLAKGEDQPYAAISPYTCVARHYKVALGADQAWLDPITPSTKLWSDLVHGHPALASLPWSLYDWCKRFGIRSTFKAMHYNLTEV